MTVLVVLSLLLMGGGMAYVVPLTACPGCEGKGVNVVPEGHYEGTRYVRTKRMIEAPCWNCGGHARITLYQRWTWQPPSLSDR